MDLEQKKTLRRLIGCFALFLVLRVVEELVVIPNYVDSKGVVACLGGIVVLLFYIRFVNKPLEDIGMIFSGHKIGKAIGMTALLNILPAVLVFGGEYLIYSTKDGYANLSVYYESVDRSYSRGGLQGLLIGLGICLALAVLHGFFYEMAFRGLLITLGSRTLPFNAVNAIQAGLYTFWYLIPVVRLLFFAPEGMYSSERMIRLVLFTLAYEMITAIKLGLLRNASGSVWVCIFDHIAFAFILDMLHLQFSSSGGALSTDMSYYGRLLAYQGIALFITYIYYAKKTKKVRDIQQKIQLESQNA